MEPRTQGPRLTRFLVIAKAPVLGAEQARLRLPPEKAADLRAALVCDVGGKARVSGRGPVAVAGVLAEDLPLLRASYRTKA